MICCGEKSHQGGPPGVFSPPDKEHVFGEGKLQAKPVDITNHLVKLAADSLCEREGVFKTLERRDIVLRKVFPLPCSVSLFQTLIPGSKPATTACNIAVQIKWRE